ncbi:unnamed protein product [Schistosoma mattheei]|uniref:Adenine DNA glycosylase n=1 Tax=Schistosoma mattheei TaxID=31246 RepID=A0AA85BTX1_9TREM|nr:unnamed protein product [Schistosoma mattheei]
MCSIHSFTSNQIEKLRESLLLWYDRSKRDLPWRRMALNPDPNLRGYAVWVSEVMLQQTQVKTVIDYYDRWMKKWPSVDQLASASLDDVNSLWSGLGYYSRARLLHKGAKKIVNEFNSIFPQSAEVLKHSIPGVGRYTAGAIASIAFNQCTPVLDGNVIRVLTRLRQIGSPVQLPTSMEYLWNLATKLVDPNRPGDFNQALMELGAVCCTPKNPDCMKCPLNKVGLCESYKQANASKSDYISTDLEDCHLCINSSVYQKSLGVMNYPVKLSKREPRKQNTVILITHTSRKENEALKNYYLLLQRPKTGLLAGLWEFPSSTYFSHIHMTYIVFELKVEQQQQQQQKTIPSECLNNSNTTTATCDWPPSLNSGRWVSREDLNDSAISTATRKVFAHFENSKSSHSEVDRNQRKIKRISTNKQLLNSKQSKLDHFFH